jgi:tetratricopeptide (TPR) repeat protein
LLDQLEAAGLLPRHLLGIEVAWTDITGDGRPDVALSVVSPHSDAFPPSGRLYLFACQGDHYQLAFASPELPDYSAPVIHAAQDLTGDGQADLLISRTACGAHTCTAQIEVLLWRSGALENRLEGASDDLPSPVIEVRGPTPQGTFDIAVTGTGINSIGAGPYRQRTRTWSWDPASQTYVPGADVLLESNFRIHVLHDADQAAAMGDFAEALALYGQVIEDDALDDWISGNQGRANLSAFAMYRRVLTFLRWGKPVEAQAAYQALLAAHPAGSPGSAYAQMAEAFWSAYQSEADLAKACTVAQGFAASNAEQVLDPLYFGYANPAYTASDICPVGP